MLTSRVSGLIREMLMARLFGAGLVNDAFITGFRIPNLTRDLFAVLLLTGQRIGDALAFPFESLPPHTVVVANLPYYISTPIIQKLIVRSDKFISLTLMLQKEVAERIAAPPGGKEYGYLSVLVQFYTIPRMEFKVPPGAFTPNPEVDSSVITLTMRDQPAVTVKDQAFFIRVIKAAFSQRRKTLRNSLKQLEAPKDRIDSVFKSTGIDLGRRAETLSVEEFGRLADFLMIGSQ